MGATQTATSGRPARRQKRRPMKARTPTPRRSERSKRTPRTRGSRDSRDHSGPTISGFRGARPLGDRLGAPCLGPARDASVALMAANPASCELPPGPSAISSRSRFLELQLGRIGHCHVCVSDQHPRAARFLAKDRQGRSFLQLRGAAIESPFKLDDDRHEPELWPGGTIRAPMRSPD